MIKKGYSVTFKLVGNLICLVSSFREIVLSKLLVFMLKLAYTYASLQLLYKNFQAYSAVIFYSELLNMLYKVEVNHITNFSPG